MARHQDQGFEGRRPQDRGRDDGRGAWGREDEERRGTMDDRRYEDEPWASREREGWPPESSRGGYRQGGYWQSEASHRGQGGYGPGTYDAPGVPYGPGQYGRGSAAQGSWGRGAAGAGHPGFGPQGLSAWDPRQDSYADYGSGERGWYERRGSGMQEWGHAGPYAGRGPKGYQRSDERIKDDICERLTQHGDLDASDIEVKVSNREITLTGTVPSRQAKRMAEDLAESISGVTDVNNQLRVSHEASAQHGQSPQTHAGMKGSRTA